MIEYPINNMDLIEVSCWDDSGKDHIGQVFIEDDDGCLNTHELITQVEVRPVLYVKTIHQHISNKEILKTWAEVASNINANRNDCLRIWRKLMKTFRRFHESPEVMMEDCEYMDHLRFLQPLLAANELVDYDKHLYIDTIDQPRADDQFFTNALPVKLDIVDNEDMFLLSFAPNMTRMNTKQNAQARIRILQELYSLEFDDE